VSLSTRFLLAHSTNSPRFHPAFRQQNHKSAQKTADYFAENKCSYGLQMHWQKQILLLHNFLKENQGVFFPLTLYQNNEAMHDSLFSYQNNESLGLF
jgi:hypothetical protein